MLFRSYVEVPFMLNYHDQKKTTLSIGASVNRLVNQYEEIGPWSGGVSRPTGIRDLNNFSYEFKAGGSYQLNNHFLFNVIYSYSITRMGTSEDSRFLNFGMYNNLLEFRIGYLIKGQAAK